jgi:DNA-directed RNA polymerase subunit omega
MAKKHQAEIKPQPVEVVRAEGKPPDQPWFIPQDPEESVYRFIIAAARRARQLQAGARPLISTTSRKPTKIAMEEIRTGDVAVEFVSVEQFDEMTDAEKAEGF